MYFKVVISMEKFVSNLSKCYTVITRYEPALHPLANQPPPLLNPRATSTSYTRYVGGERAWHILQTACTWAMGTQPYHATDADAKRPDGLCLPTLPLYSARHLGSL